MFFTNDVLPWLFCILLEYRCVYFLHLFIYFYFYLLHDFKHPVCRWIFFIGLLAIQGDEEDGESEGL